MEKEYMMVDGKIKRIEDEDLKNIDTSNKNMQTDISKDNLQESTSVLQNKELEQRIILESRLSNLAFPLTILAWTTVVALIINTVISLAYL